MKKIFLSVAMSALFLIGSLSMISMAPPAPNSQCAAIAKEFAAELEELGLSKGQFISFCNVCFNESESTANQAVCVCKQFLLFEDFSDLPEDFGITNFGQCVNFVKNQ